MSTPVELRPWDDASSAAPFRIHAAAARAATGALDLEYRLSGPLARLRIPTDTGAAGPRDGLWRHTCFEVFVSGAPPAYVEWNFSPARDWARYAFAGYREPLAADGSAASGSAPAALSVERTPAAPSSAGVEALATLVLRARIPLDAPPAATGSLRLGLSAVLEHADGSLGYWALAHPGARPDFHDPRSFLLCL